MGIENVCMSLDVESSSIAHRVAMRQSATSTALDRPRIPSPVTLPHVQPVRQQLRVISSQRRLVLRISEDVKIPEQVGEDFERTIAPLIE